MDEFDAQMYDCHLPGKWRMTMFCPQIRPKVDPESWPLMATDLNPEVPEFVPTFVTSVPQPIKEEEVRYELWGLQSTYRVRGEIVGVYLPFQLERTLQLCARW
jgi:hypothetical protein